MESSSIHPKISMRELHSSRPSANKSYPSCILISHPDNVPLGLAVTIPTVGTFLCFAKTDLLNSAIVLPLYAF